MAGESEDGLEKRHEVDVPIERTIKGIAKWKQIIVYLAGVTMNFITGFIIIVIACMTISLGDYKVTYINPASTAQGILVAGDYIIEKDGVACSEVDNIYPTGASSVYTIERNGEILEKIVLKDNINEPFQYVHPKVSFIQALQRAPGIFMSFASAIIDGLKSIFQHPENLSGIVGIYSYTNEAVAEGITVFLLLMALISINIGIFNLLPLPVMDGGRVVILIVEVIMGHELNKELETRIMLACAGVLVLIMLWAFGMDIYRLFTGEIKLF